MDFIYHRISLDIHTAKSQATLKVKQGDTSRKLLITLCENGLPYHIADDCYADFSAVKADGNYLFNDCTISGNTIEYTFTAQTSAAVGAMACEITLYGKDGQRITSPRFTIIVEETVYNGEEIVSSPEANALNELIDRAEHAVDNAESFVDGFNFRVNNTFANAVKGKVSGAVVQVDDVSPVEHIVGCKVRSKNLWNMGALKDTRLLSLNADGSVTVVASNYACTSENKLKEFCPSLQVGDTVTLSISTTGRPLIYLVGANVRIDRGTTITITEAMLNSLVTFYGAYTQDADFDVAHTVYSIQLELGTEATDYVPYTDVGSVNVTRCGKNLASPNLYTGKVGGYTYAPNEDGSVTISGAATTTSQHVIALALKKANGENDSVRLVPNQTYTLTIYKNGVKTNGIGTKVEFDDGTIKWGFDKVSSKPRKLTLVYVQFTPAAGDTEHCGTYHVQLELGDTATPYEKYIGDQYTVAADGTVNGMTSVSPVMSIFPDTDNALIDCEYNRDSNEVLKEVLKFIDQGGTTPAVARIVDIFLSAEAWVEKDEYYSQVVSVEGATSRSQVDLTPSVEQLAIFHDKDLAFVTENVGGVVTVYAIGQKPTNDYTMQATVTEVNV